MPKPPEEEPPKTTPAEVKKAKEVVATLKAMGEPISERLQQLADTKTEVEKNAKPIREPDIHAVTVRLYNKQQELEKKN